MHAPYRRRNERQVTQIVCLVCGETRVVSGALTDDAGKCGRCGYAGWTYAEELDGTTRRMLADGAATTVGAKRPHRRDS